MTKVREIYRCQICGNVVEVVNPGAVLSCCGEPMKLMKENTSDGAKEKHVPVIEPIEGGYRVTVGSVEHSMFCQSEMALRAGISSLVAILPLVMFMRRLLAS